jgi:tetratricopeptide (TPR) repeat protein
MRGNLMAKHGNLVPALAEFDRVLLSHPQSSEAWIAKGKVLTLKNETTGALRAFQRAAEIDPTSFEAHYGAATLLLSMPGEGVAAAMPYLVRAYEHRGNDAAARALRETLLKLPIQSADTYVALATADADRRDPDGALEWVARALKIDPDSGPALYLKGGMLKAKGDDDGALAAWKRACEVLPDSILAFASTGSLLVELGNRDEARTYLKKALAIARQAAADSVQAREIVPALEKQIAGLESAPR